MLETRYYTVKSIEGEYAVLTDTKDGGEIFIAMALLPPNVDVGSSLRYEMLEYSLIR